MSARRTKPTKSQIDRCKALGHRPQCPTTIKNWTFILRNPHSLDEVCLPWPPFIVFFEKIYCIYLEMNIYFAKFTVPGPCQLACLGRHICFGLDRCWYTKVNSSGRSFFASIKESVPIYTRAYYNSPLLLDVSVRRPTVESWGVIKTKHIRQAMK